MDLKPGVRLRSPVCEVEAIVIKAPPTSIDLRCGGHPMLAIDATPPAASTAEPGFDGGSALGKRYTDGEGTLEVLCTKPGPSSLSVGDKLLQIKAAKPLPSSD